MVTYSASNMVLATGTVTRDPKKKNFTLGSYPIYQLTQY